MATWLSLDWDCVTGDARHDCNVCGLCSYNCDEDPFVSRKVQIANDNFKESFNYARFLVRRQWKQVVVRECHADISVLLRDGDVVINLDAHTDDYNNMDELDCGNWVNHANRRDIAVHNLAGDLACYRREVERAMQNLVPDRLFICWSIPYTNTGADKAFWRLCKGVGVTALTHFTKDQEDGLRLWTGGNYGRPGVEYLTRVIGEREARRRAP